MADEERKLDIVMGFKPDQREFDKAQEVLKETKDGWEEIAEALHKANSERLKQLPLPETVRQNRALNDVLRERVDILEATTEATDNVAVASDKLNEVFGSLETYVGYAEKAGVSGSAFDQLKDVVRGLGDFGTVLSGLGLVGSVAGGVGVGVSGLAGAGVGYGASKALGYEGSPDDALGTLKAFPRQFAGTGLAAFGTTGNELIKALEMDTSATDKLAQAVGDLSVQIFNWNFEDNPEIKGIFGENAEKVMGEWMEYSEYRESAPIEHEIQKGKLETNYIKSQEDLRVQHHTTMTQLSWDHYDQEKTARRNFERTWEINRRTFNRTEIEMEERHQKGIQDLLENAREAQEQAEENYEKKRRGIIETNQEYLLDKEERFRLNQKRALEDHEEALYGFARTRDAHGIIRENRRYALQKTRSEEDHALAVDKAHEQTKERLDDLAKAKREEDAIRKESYEENMAELVANNEEARVAREEAYNLRLADAEENYDYLEGLRETAYQEAKAQAIGAFQAEKAEREIAYGDAKFQLELSHWAEEISRENHFRNILIMYSDMEGHAEEKMMNVRNSLVKYMTEIGFVADALMSGKHPNWGMQNFEVPALQLPTASTPETGIPFGNVVLPFSRRLPSPRIPGGGGGTGGFGGVPSRIDVNARIQVEGSQGIDTERVQVIVEESVSEIFAEVNERVPR